MAYNLNIGTLYIHSVTDIVWLLTFYYKLQKNSLWRYENYLFYLNIYKKCSIMLWFG